MKITASPKFDSQCSDSGTIAFMSDAPHTVTAAALAEINCSTADFVNDMKRLTLKLTGLRRQPGVSSHCVWSQLVHYWIWS